MARQKTNILYQHRMFIPSILKEASTNDCVIYSFIYVCLIIILFFFLSKWVVMQIGKSQVLYAFSLVLNLTVHLLVMDWLVSSLAVPLNTLTSSTSYSFSQLVYATS